MASFKCKKCKEKNTIPQEWITLGINRIVSCNTCNHKMNINLAGTAKQEPIGTQIVDNLQSHNHSLETPTGTQIDGLSSGATNNTYSIEVVQGKKNTMSIDIASLGETHHIYLGRNPASKKSMNPDNEASYIIDDPYVSRLHCQITVLKQSGQAKFILQDGGSANGTEVNQNKLDSGDQVLLNIGDQITIGDTKIILKKN